MISAGQRKPVLTISGILLISICCSDANLDVPPIDFQFGGGATYSVISPFAPYYFRVRLSNSSPSNFAPLCKCWVRIRMWKD